ncbi:MAG: hypothetical protein GXP13_03400 [Gammaproteobacteria bacterium]|nr:hypothetical protein [Gammaproteobacteria bacterium]
MVTPTDDVAWASIKTPLAVNELMTFCRDIERLFRINPLLEFKNWEIMGENQYRFVGKNISQETPFEFEIDLDINELNDGYKIEYSNGIKSSTVLKIESITEGSKLTITDYYDGLSEKERQLHLDEVDKSLVVWAKYLQKYLMTWKRWSGFAPWRWYMRRIWQPMKPMGRRITYMLLWISVVEVVLIALGVAIYWVEYK